MKEIKTILENLQKAHSQNKRCALATVVNVHGSSYRRAGARMLILEDGHWFGSVSGGCLEGDVIMHAKEVMHSGQLQIYKYDTRQNAENAFGMGYGCNGILEILIEVITFDKKHPLYSILHHTAYYSGRQAMATVYYSEDAAIAMVGERLHSSGEFSIGDTQLQQLVQSDLLLAVEANESTSKTYRIDGKKVKVFLEVLPPNINILIFGAVFHVVPFLRIANELGYNVHITDSFEPIQPVWNFPHADEVSLIDDAAARKIIDNTPSLAVVFLTHNFFYIKDQLPYVLRSNAAYVGILGSRKKTQKILRETEVNEANYSADELAKVHYPIGLDIGANTPEEISLSIIAEIRAFFSRKSGESLRKFDGAIHTQTVENP